MLHLNGKVAIITGSSKGIGQAIANHLAEAGASVVVNSRSPKEAQVVSGQIGNGAMGAMARQPEAINDLRANMILMAALVEGAAFFAMVIGLLVIFTI